MSSHDLEHVKEDIRRFNIVGITLGIGTILTVAAYYIHFDNFAYTVALALLIATVKASLVAGFFMHLISEKVMIYAVMAFTFFFFGAMMFLFIWGKYDIPRIF